MQVTLASASEASCHGVLTRAIARLQHRAEIEVDLSVPALVPRKGNCAAARRIAWYRLIRNLPVMPWSTNLARPIVLYDGTDLVTFKDAVEALINSVAGWTESAAHERALKLLVSAENSGKAADIEAATEQVELVLRPFIVRPWRFLNRMFLEPPASA